MTSVNMTTSVKTALMNGFIASFLEGLAGPDSDLKSLCSRSLPPLTSHFDRLVRRRIAQHFA